MHVAITMCEPGLMQPTIGEHSSPTFFRRTERPMTLHYCYTECKENTAEFWDLRQIWVKMLFTIKCCLITKNERSTSQPYQTHMRSMAREYLPDTLWPMIYYVIKWPRNFWKKSKKFGGQMSTSRCRWKKQRLSPFLKTFSKGSVERRYLATLYTFRY